MGTLPRKRRLVVLDVCPQTLRTVARLAAPYYEVRLTQDPREAIALLEEDQTVAAFAVEHTLPTSSGVALLEAVRTRRPHVRRILLGEYEPLGSIVAGIHAGAVQHFVGKPIIEAELIAAVLPEGARSPILAVEAGENAGLRVAG